MYLGTFYIQNMSHTIYKLYLHSNRLKYLPLGASICLSGSISISKHDSFDIVTSCLLFTKRFFLQFQHLQKFLWHCRITTYTNVYFQLFEKSVFEFSRSFLTVTLFQSQLGTFCFYHHKTYFVYNSRLALGLLLFLLSELVQTSRWQKPSQILLLILIIHLEIHQIRLFRAIIPKKNERISPPL